jgi:C-terminal processing protease CtpA/Prc
LSSKSVGKFDVAHRLASYLVNKRCDAGLFAGRKYYEDADFRNNPGDFYELQPDDFSGFSAIVESKQAVKITFEPQNPLHSQIYILTNRNTASACEPLVQGLKGQSNVGIFGERTAGAMLSPTVYDMGNHFYLIVPTADYLTSEGKSIEGRGVQPDGKAKSFPFTNLDL